MVSSPDQLHSLPLKEALSHSSCEKPQLFFVALATCLHMGISSTSLELQLKLLSQVIFEIMNFIWYEKKK